MMKLFCTWSLIVTASLLLVGTPAAQADTFGSGENSFEIEFVTIGDPGNAPDTVIPAATSAPLPRGTVNYTYRMAKYEVSEEIIAKANALSGDNLGLQVNVERGPQKPATGLSWFDAARFINWLNEDAGSPVAYKFDDQGLFHLWESGDSGYNPDNPFRNTQARYFMPSADEWHKAAYFDPVNERYWLYPFGSDEPPIPVASGTDPGTAVFNQDGPADVQLAGGENLFGLVGMAGNVYDFEETSVNLVNGIFDEPYLNRRGANGGSFIFDTTRSLSASFRNSGLPQASQSTGGIRVASIPEPNSLLILLIGLYTTMLTGGRKGSIR